MRLIFKAHNGLCIRCASCASIVPEVFRVDKVGVSVLRQPAGRREIDGCEAAVINCPVGALSMSSVDAEET